jgi:hypothetical protein
MTARTSASEGADFGQRRFGVTTKLLSYFSSAWCGFSLVSIGALLTVGASKSASKVLLSAEDEYEFYGTLYGFYGTFIGGGIECLFVLGLGVASGRFLLRAVPPTISNQSSRRRFWPVALYIAFIGVYICGVSLGLVMDTDTIPPVFMMEPKTILVGIPFVIAWTFGVIGLLIHRHHRPRAFLDRPFVLFLRRFSTFSDRAVTALILQQASKTVTVVFLTPTFSQPRDWDPYLVGFAGLKLWRPWRSTPIVVRAQDDSWEGAADELIRRAHTILLDISDTSSALRTEAEMLDRTDRWPDTVCLRLLVPNAGSEKKPVGGGVRTIDYEKRWVRAVPRMLIGLPVVLAGAFIAIPLGQFGLAGLVVLLVACAAYYYSVFVRPSIDRKTRSALRKLFRAEHATSTAREVPPRGIKG